jgi:hypothetical protein
VNTIDLVDIDELADGGAPLDEDDMQALLAPPMIAFAIPRSHGFRRIDWRAGSASVDLPPIYRPVPPGIAPPTMSRL